MEKTYRMNTPKGQVQHAYDLKGGEIAAMKVAKKYDLNEARVRRWFRTWEEEAKASRAPRKTATKAEPQINVKGNITAAKAVAIAKAAKSGKLGKAVQDAVEKIFKKGDRVSYATRPKITGTVTQAGPEQSEVKWDHDRPASFVSNDALALSNIPAPKGTTKLATKLPKKK